MYHDVVHKIYYAARIVNTIFSRIEMIQKIIIILS